MQKREQAPQRGRLPGHSGTQTPSPTPGSPSPTLGSPSPIPGSPSPTPGSCRGHRSGLSQMQYGERAWRQGRGICQAPVLWEDRLPKTAHVLVLPWGECAITLEFSLPLEKTRSASSSSQEPGSPRGLAVPVHKMGQGPCLARFSPGHTVGSQSGQSQGPVTFLRNFSVFLLLEALLKCSA